MSSPARGSALPGYAVRMVGALLAIAIAAVHVADQGGITKFTSPDWLGWSYRLIEIGGLLTAASLLVPFPARIDWARWAAPIALGAGPFAGYVASRTIGLPGDPGDVGNWGYWLGTDSLIIEAALIVLGLGMLWSLRPVGRLAIA